MEVYQKDPQATLDYAFNWSDWLKDDDQIKPKADGGYILTAEEGITLLTNDMLMDEMGEDAEGNPIVLHANSIVKLWLSDGTAKKKYKVSCKILTLDGLVDERTMLIQVLDR